MDGKGKSIRGFAVFLFVMAVLSFFSRSILYSLLPKVEFSDVFGGVLHTLVVSDEYVLDSDKVKRVTIPMDLMESNLYIEQVLVRKHQFVNKDDALIQFSPEQGTNVLSQLRRAQKQLEESLRSWDIAYMNTCEKMKVEILMVQKEMSKEGADLELLEQQKQILQKEIINIEWARIVNGVSRASIEFELTDVKTLINELSTLSQHDWVLRAQNDGIVLDIMVSSGDEYRGVLPLIKLSLPGARVRVGIELVNEVNVSSANHVLVYTGDIMSRGYDGNWIFAGESIQANKQFLWAESSEKVPDIINIPKINFLIESEYMQTLVPNSAIIGGNSIYVLDRRFGAWGVEQLFARRVEVNGTRSDNQNTYIPVGLMGNEKVIIKWDRPFKDGDTVILPLD